MDLPVSAALLERVLSDLDANEPAAIGRLFDWLRIPSISTQDSHAPDCQRAAEWFRDQLRGLGFTADVHQTAGRPVVIGHSTEAGLDAPTILYYGHYDVQPADPLALWTSPPFEPQLVDGPRGKRIVARGAVDDKGQAMMWLEAFRSWRAIAGRLPVRVTVLLEGEEETGSPSLDPFLKENAAALKADVAVISDGNMWDFETPSITTRLRGTTYLQLKLRTAKCDLHSGLFGGSARNALQAMVEFLAGLHDQDGRITLPGFYDDVSALPEAVARQWAAIGFDEGAMLHQFGLATPAGERGFSALERLWSRPTLEIHGVWGGYMEKGRKTVIPAEANAKISFRIVPGQDPAKAVAALHRHIALHTPADATVEVTPLGEEGGIEIPTGSRWMEAVQAALAAEYGKPPLLGGCGGSLPVVGSLKRLWGIDTLLFSFGLDDDQVHSPNEKFELACFRHGARAHARLLAELVA
jgi:acetylornithine deacetylase/succinyl-diaminopimelate desuccinylase-like protein